MKHLHWIISDLFLPAHVMPQVSADLKLPHLEKLLARSQRSTHPARTQEELLCAAFGVNAVAPLRAQADGLVVAHEYWLCADPVHLQLQQSQAILQANVVCSEVEAATLCASLNAHFNQDGLTFFAPHPQRWYVHVGSLGEVVMHPISSVRQRDVKAYLPRGADALRWQKVINEVQMLLHGHPVNVARESKGQSPINSLWIWGGGLATALRTCLDAVGGDENLTAAFAQVAQLPCATSLPQILVGGAENGLWVSAALNEAWQSDDLYAWRERIQTLENNLAQAVWNALCKGELQSLTLEVMSENSSLQFKLTRAACYKLWRRTPPLGRYAV
jgi:hypothetical protein